MLCVVHLGPHVRILDDPPTYWLINIFNETWVESCRTWAERDNQDEEVPLVKEGLMRW